MTKDQAIAIVRAKYPMTIVVEDERAGYARMHTNPLSPKGWMRGTSGSPSSLWIEHAEDIRKGVDW